MFLSFICFSSLFDETVQQLNFYTLSLVVRAFFDQISFSFFFSPLFHRCLSSGEERRTHLPFVRKDFLPICVHAWLQEASEIQFGYLHSASSLELWWVSLTLTFTDFLDVWGESSYVSLLIVGQRLENQKHLLIWGYYNCLPHLKLHL